MDFDIFEDIFEQGDEHTEGRYYEHLMSEFERSPEAQALPKTADDDESALQWAGWLLEFGIRYIGATPPNMTPNGLRELLYDVFPGHISVYDFDAQHAIAEMRAFWEFLKRAYALPNADACLEVLGNQAVARFEKAMNDPALFGVSKSLLMMGMARGFDITTEEGVNQWLNTYNAELLAGTGTGVPFPGEQTPTTLRTRRNIHHTLRREKRKRKIADASRKKNRKKK